MAWRSAGFGESLRPPHSGRRQPAGASTTAALKAPSGLSSRGPAQGSAAPGSRVCVCDKSRPFPRCRGSGKPRRWGLAPTRRHGLLQGPETPSLREARAVRGLLRRVRGQAGVCGASSGHLPPGTGHHVAPRACWVLLHQKETDKFVLTSSFNLMAQQGGSSLSSRADRPAPGWGIAFSEMCSGLLSPWRPIPANVALGQAPSPGTGWRQSSMLTLSTLGSRSPGVFWALPTTDGDLPWLGCARAPHPAGSPSRDGELLIGENAPQTMRLGTDSPPQIYTIQHLSTSARSASLGCLLIRGRALGQT